MIGYDSFKHSGVTPEVWYIAGVANVGNLSTDAPALNTLYAIPLISSRGGTIDRIGFNKVSGLNTGVARVGIYNNMSYWNLYPNGLVLDGGEKSMSGTGMKSSTINQILLGNNLYWAVYLAGTAQATIRSLTPSHCHNGLGVDNLLSISLGVGWKVTQTYGVLPPIFPSGASIMTTTPIPAIGIRYLT
jgi:hypothetical protein